MKYLGFALLAVVLAGGFLWSESASRAPFKPERAVQGKPNPAVGWLHVTVVDRPSPDRAWIKAVWTRGSDAQNCRLLFFPGREANLMEGDADTTLDPDASGGEVVWLVDFPTDRDIDGVVRLCAETRRGVNACEAYVPLARGQ